MPVTLCHKLLFYFVIPDAVANCIECSQKTIINSKEYSRKTMIPAHIQDLL